MPAFEAQLQSEIDQVLSALVDDPTAAQELARQLCSKQVNLKTPGSMKLLCTSSREFPLLLGLSNGCKSVLACVLQPSSASQQLTEAHTQARLDTCALLLNTTSIVLRAIGARNPTGKMEDSPFSRRRMENVVNTGIIRAVSVACTNAHSLLTQQGSAAAMHSSFSQFLVAVLALWNDLIHLLPNNTQKLSGAEDDPLAPLLLPGAALSSAALKTYLGPDAAAIAASDGRVAAGYTFVPVLGDTAAAGLAAAVQVQCLCVGEQIVKCCYYYYMLDMQGTSVIQAQEHSLPGKVARDTGVMQLVLVMLCVLTQVMHEEQQGVAAVAVPKTARTGRPSQRAGRSVDGQRVQVPPHHNALAAALDMHALTEPELFNIKELSKAAASLYPLTTLDPAAQLDTYRPAITGLCPSVLQRCVLAAEDPAAAAARLVLSDTQLAPPLDDRTVLAVLLVCVELCLLGDEKCAESALRLMSMMKQYLSHLTDGMPGNQAVMSFDSNWHAGLARWRLPARLPLAAQTLEGLVSLVVPLMLPTCHLLPLPSEHPGFVGLVSALLPQQLLNISVQAGDECVRRLLEQHPLAMTRALEAALRVDHSQRHTPAAMRSMFLQMLPGTLASLGLPPPTSTTAGEATASSDSGAGTAAAAGAADAVSGPGQLIAAAATNRQLLAQLHALLVSLAKYASQMNTAVVSNTLDMRSANEMVRNLPAGLAGDPRHIAASIAAMMRTKLPSGPGQFRGTLQILGSTADAACRLGRGACMAAAASAAGDAASDAGPSSSSTTSSNSSSVPEQRQLDVAAPFVSVIARCMYLVAGAVTAGVGASKLATSEFSSCVSVLRMLQDSLWWLLHEPACCALLDEAGGSAADTAAAAELQSELHQLLGGGGASASEAAIITKEKGAEEGHATACELVESGLARSLQAFGAAACGITLGVCANPSCSTLTELSELAVVSASGGKKGRGKCSGCKTVAYCSRDCQVKHWPAHKRRCKAGKQQQA